MNNFDVARQALEVSANSAGSAMREHEKASQSLEFRLNKLKSTWQSLSQTFMGSDFLKSVLDGVIALVNGLDKLINTLGALPTLLGVFGAAKFALNITKSVGSIKSFADILDVLKTSFPTISKLGSALFSNLSTAVGTFIAAMASGTGTVTAFKAAFEALNLTMLKNPIFAVAAAVGVAIVAHNKWKKSIEELARKVEDVTTSYKEQHSELQKLEGDFDTSNADSMISKYGRLSKGVNELGENVSLTSSEYAEYQSIVDTIANQFPSLVTGYNSQGDAILSCKGSVEELTQAYKDLILAENEAVLDAGSDIFKDFKNDLKGAGLYDPSKNITSVDGHLVELQNLLNLSGDKLENSLIGNSQTIRISQLLEENGIKRDVLGSGEKGYESYSEHIIRALEKDRVKVKQILEDASIDLNAYAEELGTATEAYFSTAFLGGDGDIGDYSHFSERMQNIINQVTSNFGAEFYAQFLDDENPYESLTKYYSNMLKAFDSLDGANVKEFEAAFNLKTQFNSGDISYGEYISSLQNAASLIDGLGLDEEVTSQIKLSLGLSEKDGKWVLEEYETLLNRLTSEEYDIQLNTDSAETFLKNLSASEVQVAVDFIESDNADFKSALQNYKDVFNEAKEAGVDFSKTVFGNIDTNARQTLEWTSGNLKRYKDELMSWEPKDASWDKVRKDLEGSISTVMGTWETFDIGKDKKVPIAFSPMLQTDKGAEVLSSGTVNAYISQLISKATEDGKWDKKELIALDSKGLEVDGRKIKGILADVGEAAEATAKQMHFVGKDGALALAEAEINAIVETQAKINEAMAFTTDIEVDTTALETLNTALSESASAMGLTEESIDGLKAKYSKLESFDAATLFEATANGVKVNREELAKLEKKYNDLTKSEVKEHIDSLTEAYNDATAEIDKCRNAGERAQLLSKREGYKTQIEELAEYQAQLEGVTGAYQRWIDSQNTPEDYEGYQAVATSREDIKDEINRGFISNASKEYIDLLSGKDLQGGTIDDYAEAWDRLGKKVGSTSYSIHDFFTVNDDGDITATGIDRFFDGIKKDFNGSVAEFNKETGKWTYDFSQKNLQKIQDEWGIGIEAIGLLLEAAASAGYDVDWDNILEGIDLDTSNFETLVSYAEKAQKAFNELEGVEDVDFNFTATGVEEATSELEKARSTYIDLITNDDGTINLKAEGAEQMRVILSTLLVQKQQLEDSNIAINIDTSGLDESQQDIANAIEAVKTFREKYKNLEIAVTTGQGIDAAKTELSKAMGELQTLGGEGVDIAAQLILGEGTDGETLKTKVDAAITAVGDKNIKVGCKLDETAIGTLNSQILTNFTPEATVKITGIDDALVNQYTSTEKTAEGTVKWKNDESLVVQYQEKTKKAVGIVDWANNTDNVKKNFSASGTVTWTSGNNVKVKVISSANGTANLNGTANFGRAFRQGDWGIKGSGTALVGELGMETLVRGGKFYTIGDTGAEFIQYRPNDIIFNHKQTEELFRYGKVLSDGGRGRVYADGSAFANGSYPSSGRAFPEYGADVEESDFLTKRKKKKKKTTTKTTTTKTTKPSSSKNSVTGQTYNKNSSTSSKSKDTKDTEEEFEETFDWVEVAISRIERTIDRLDQKANRTYKSWSSRNNNLTKEISKVGDEIDLQSKAYNEYMAAANGVGLSSKWKKKVQNGKVDINTIKDETLAEKIKSYQDYYEKALECKDAILDLQDTEMELYKQRFDNVQSKYDGILQGFEHTETMLNEYIAQAEAQGHIVSKKYYDALISNEKQNISQLKKEQLDLIAARDEWVANGGSKNSQDWYDMCAEIDAVTQAIEEGTTSLIEYDNAMRQIDWDTFDLKMQGISDVNDEADFLIDLMSNDDLHDDKGKLTGQGAATLGLHGQKHNTYMYAADEYGAEIANLDKQIAKDPYDQELINRRRELIELQRESILAAEDEKQAIKDLVQEGIDKELDSLQELIDKKNESLQAEKDLYEYNKQVQEQTENIASLRKQIGAYENDNSEEAKAKLQELRVSLSDAETELKETEWDKYIQDTEQILDTLYTEYETTLNTRLDNVDYLLEQVIVGINASMGEGGVIDTALGESGAIASAIANTVGENGGMKTILNSELGAVGTTLSTTMDGIWSVGEGNAKSILTTYGEDFKTKSTTVNTTLNGIKIGIDNMITALNKDAKDKIDKNKTSPSTEKDPTKDKPTTTPTDTKPTTTPTDTKPTTTPTDTKPTTTTGDGKAKVGDKVKFVSGQYYYSSDGQKPIGSKNLGKQVYITKINTASWATHPYHISTGKKLGSGDLGWLKLNQLSGYASGKRNFSNNEWAWTQEGRKEEYIIRPSDGAILTPVAKGDSILNATASGNIWSMANNPAEFIKNNLGLDSANVPNGGNVNNSIVQNFENITFSMPNVHNYDETIRQMQRDPKFEKLILAMTLDQIAGKSSLAKGKSIR